MEACEEGESLACWWGCKVVEPLGESSMEFPQKLNKGHHNLSSEYTPKANEISYLQDTEGLLVNYSVSPVPRSGNNVSIHHEWMDKEIVHTMEFLFSLRKQDLAICDNVNEWTTLC